MKHEDVESLFGESVFLKETYRKIKVKGVHLIFMSTMQQFDCKKTSK